MTEMKSKTLMLFAISALILVGALLISIFKENIGLGEDLRIIGVVATVAFGTSIAGLVLGISEIKRNSSSKNWIGIIGNLLIVAMFILISIYAIR
jgi:hypothetical protein